MDKFLFNFLKCLNVIYEILRIGEIYFASTYQ